MPSGEEGGRGCFRGEAVSHRRPRPLRRPRGNLARPHLRTARPSMEFAPLLRPVGGRHQGSAKVTRESVRRPSTDDVGGRNRFQTDRHGDTDDRPRRDVGGLMTVTAGTRRGPEAGTGDCHTAAAAAAATVRTRTGRPAWGEPGPRPGGGSRPGPRGRSPPSRGRGRVGRSAPPLLGPPARAAAPPARGHGLARRDQHLGPGTFCRCCTRRASSAGAGETDLSGQARAVTIAARRS
jgi:hypothetical protein